MYNYSLETVVVLFVALEAPLWCFAVAGSSAGPSCRAPDTNGSNAFNAANCLSAEGAKFRMSFDLKLYMSDKVDQCELV